VVSNLVCWSASRCSTLTAASLHVDTSDDEFDTAPPGGSRFSHRYTCNKLYTSTGVTTPIITGHRYLPSALARELMEPPPSVRPSVSTLTFDLNRVTFEFDLLRVVPLPVKVQRCPTARKVTVGLASH